MFALAYNLANFLRQLVLPKPIRGWTLTTLREKFVKIGAKVVRHSKYVLFQLAEVAVPRKLFSRVLGRIARLCATCLGLRLGRSGNRVRKPSPGVRGAQRGAISRSTWRRRAGYGDSGDWSNAVRSSCG